MELLWSLADGDPWRDLTAEIAALPDGKATILTGGSGTVHLVQHGGRIRLPGGHKLLGDLKPHPVAAQRVTPCGASWDDAVGFWHRSSQVVAVWAGHEDPAIVREYIKRMADGVAELDGGMYPDPPGHPAEPCGALWCPALGERAGDPYASVGDDVIPMPDGVPPLPWHT